MVKLKGLARTANVRLEVDVDAPISLGLARAEVAGVFTNLGKAEFSRTKGSRLSRENDND